VRRWNAGAERIYGYSAQEALGNTPVAYSLGLAVARAPFAAGTTALWERRGELSPAGRAACTVPASVPVDAESGVEPDSAVAADENEQRPSQRLSGGAAADQT